MALHVVVPYPLPPLVCQNTLCPTPAVFCFTYHYTSVFEKYLCYIKLLKHSQSGIPPLFLAPNWSANFDVPMETTHGAPLDSVGSDVWSTEEPMPTKETGWASFSEFTSSLRWAHTRLSKPSHLRTGREACSQLNSAVNKIGKSAGGGGCRVTRKNHPLPPSFPPGWTGRRSGWQSGLRRWPREAGSRALTVQPGQASDEVVPGRSWGAHPEMQRVPCIWWIMLNVYSAWS